MVDKIYLALEHSNEGSYGDYVSLFGAYVNKDEAGNRCIQLIENYRNDEQDFGYVKKSFEVIEVELDKNIEAFIGGYVD